MTRAAFTIDRHSLDLLHAVLTACRNGQRVTLFDEATGAEMEGVARVIVGPDHLGSVTEYTPDCRLHVSGVSEVWIPLASIQECAPWQDGLILTLATN